MQRIRLASAILFAATVTLAAPPLASAASYPVSGRWTYDYSSAEGPAKECGSRRMEFTGERRFDTGGGVPDYRILSLTRSGASQFQIIDEFNTGQINARLDYVLRVIDSDHIELNLASGAIIQLRRCA
jgi:hypothetical protein